MVVMLGHRQHALARHIAAPQHILEERNYVVSGLGSAEGDHNNGIVVHITWSDWI